jgi:hypothetical protein
MLQNVSFKDKQILRDLARKQYEYSQLPQMKQLKKEWVLHNDCKGQRPMITVELWTFYNDIIPPLLKCEGEAARSIESMLYSNIVNFALFKDDTVVKDYIPISYHTYFKPFDIDVKVEHVSTDSSSLGYQFVEVVRDLKNDFDLLKKSSFGFNREGHIKYQDMLNELIGDILPVKLSGSCLVVSPTHNLVCTMSMATMFVSMYDYPNEFKYMLSNLIDDYLEYFELLEKEQLILPTVGGEGLGQGTFCYTEDLPGYDIFFVSNTAAHTLYGYIQKFLQY